MKRANPQNGRCVSASEPTPSGYSGDYLDIECISDGMVHITVGHQCAAQGYIMPVDVITATLAAAWADPDPVKWPLPWSDDLSGALRAKIRKALSR